METSSPLPDPIAVYAITERGCLTAKRLSENMTIHCFCPEKLRRDDFTTYPDGTFPSCLTAQWKQFSGHIFLMATGIVVRQIQPLITDKTIDPAVVVCDESGRFAISLLSGHIGGANRLANAVAEILGATPVITTATDTQNLPAFDEVASYYGYMVTNREMIKVLNSLLLSRRKIAVCAPPEILERHYHVYPFILPPEKMDHPEIAGAVIFERPEMTEVKVPSGIPVLKFRKR